MRRTTICRSSASVTIALLVLAATGRAQQPPPIQRPIEQAQRAAQQAAGQQPAAAAQQPGQPQQASAQQPQVAVPATYIVQQGETLWSLAERFFGDPLLWPEIYRLNTTVVEDPHWIFPGEELRLAPLEPAPAAAAQGPEVITVTPQGDTVRAAPQPQRPAPEWTPTIFAGGVQQVARQQEEIELRTERAYRAVREGEYFSAGFLTEDQPLPSGRVIGNVQTSAIRRLSSSSSAQPFGSVAVRPPEGEQLSRGDLLLAFRRAGEVRGYGEVIRPTGLLIVTSADGDQVVAEVTRLFGQVHDGQEFLKTAPFRWDNSRRAVPVTDGITAQVVARRDPRELMALQDVLFLNRGADDGVRLGDVFRVSSPSREGASGQELDQGQVLVVNTRSRTSSAVIIELYRPDIRPGSVARQVRRMPS